MSQRELFMSCKSSAEDFIQSFLLKTIERYWTLKWISIYTWNKGELDTMEGNSNSIDMSDERQQQSGDEDKLQRKFHLDFIRCETDRMSVLCWELFEYHYHRIRALSTYTCHVCYFSRKMNRKLHDYRFTLPLLCE